MINLKNEISKIIKSVDFIVLPGFGAFQSEYSKPYFSDNYEIVESNKKIIFISFFKRDIDQKLITLLSKSTNLPNSLILDEYNSLIDNINKNLDLNKKYDWENLGLFYKNSDNIVEFFENKIELSPVMAIGKKVLEENYQEKTSPKFDKFFENKIIENESFEKFKYYKLALYLVPILLLFSSLIWTVFLKPNNVVIERKTTSFPPDSLEIENMISETADSDSEYVSFKDKKIEPKREREKELKEIESKSNKIIETNKNIIPQKSQVFYDNSIDKKYEIIIGVYKSRENVDNLTTFLAENGIPARSRKDKNFFKVYLNANSLEQAEMFSSKIEDLTGEKPVINN